MEYRIRRAKAEEALRIAELMLLAMEDIAYQLIGEKDPIKAKQFLSKWISRPQNLYSYQHIWVLEVDHKIAVSMVIYDGSEVEKWREPLLRDLPKELSQRWEVETEAGEYYIDTIATDLAYQGQGLGKKMLQFAIDLIVFQQKKVLGLLVDVVNPKAKRLYRNVGFQEVGKKSLLGHQMEHLQYRPHI
jgi:ribosomal protein S18 acetylase RimI-like enzyme